MNKNQIKIISPPKVELLFCFVSIMFLFFNCTKKETKIPGIPAGIEVIKLADIIANPQNYDGKKIILEGTASSVCASGCDFIFQEGPNTISIQPKGFRIPKLKIGQPVKVYAEIKSGTERIVITALGLGAK